MTHIGLDPGRGGAMCCFYSGSNQPSLYPFEKLTDADWADLLREAANADECVAYLEKVHSMPRQGVASTFTFGEHYGKCQGILTALQIPFHYVLPARWQQGLGLRKKEKAESDNHWKNYLKGEAQRLFPSEKITLATADALLIAEWGRKQK